MLTIESKSVLYINLSISVWECWCKSAFGLVDIYFETKQMLDSTISINARNSLECKRKMEIGNHNKKVQKSISKKLIYVFYLINKQKGWKVKVIFRQKYHC